MNTACRVFVGNVISPTHPTQFLYKVTYQRVNIDKGNFQAKYEKEKS
jgi:hypothetical protein